MKSAARETTEERERVERRDSQQDRDRERVRFQKKFIKLFKRRNVQKGGCTVCANEVWCCLPMQTVARFAVTVTVFTTVYLHLPTSSGFVYTLVFV